MVHKLTLEDFAQIDQIIAEPLRFKAKLAIGEAAYTSLKTVNKARELWDVLGAAGTGAAVAKSSLIAGTFFAPSGLMGMLGIGTAATPIGWVAFAALASGGACYGLYRYFNDARATRVIEIPRFLNTPLDTLGLALFDLIAPIALQLAAVDGLVEDAEREALKAHLIEEWGMDQAFVSQAITMIEPAATAGSLDDMAMELSQFLHANPDCHHASIAKDLSGFLREMLEAAGPLTEQEIAALERTSIRLANEPPPAWRKAWSATRQSAVEALRKAGNASADAANAAKGWTAARVPSQEKMTTVADLTLSKVRDGTASASAWAKGAIKESSQVREQLHQSLKTALTKLKTESTNRKDS